MMKSLLVFLLASTAGAVAHAQAPGDRGSSVASSSARDYGQGEPDDPQRALARLHANATLDAEISRVASLRISGRARLAAQNTENRRRCQVALQVAALCGAAAARFSCDETGFRPLVESTTFAPSAVANDARYSMQRCESQARRGSP